MKVEQPTWIYVAGNRTNIMAGDPHSWRCFFDPSDDEHRIRDFKPEGMMTARNFKPGVQREGLPHRDIFAWVQFYGTAEIRDDEVLYIVLADPPEA